MKILFVDADACPVRAEAERVADRHGWLMKVVSNGGIRPSAHPRVETVIVSAGPDVADDWIAERAGTGDVVVTADIPLAARCVAAGAGVMRPDGRPLGPQNIGEAVAARDLAASLRSADPFRQGGGKPFDKTDRARFLDNLDRMVRAVR